ncbi:MAG: hypothetical protein FD156_1125 [Nitrospirae bacterium]|nr:MAG: hypothetical protein FD156_1125 [Nitrospirota bacterium]
MNIFEIDKLKLFLVFFVPGFISMKIYGLLLPGERRDFSKDTFEAIAYSAFNFAALSWLISLIHLNSFYTNHKAWYFVSIFIIMFVFPVIWPILFVKISTWNFVAKHIIHPIQKPWDYIFGKKEAYWIIVHLKNGKRIGGKYDTKSFTSSFPAKEQIYLEQVWKLDEKGGFLKPIDRSEGIIILGDDIVSVELFH